MTWYYYKWFNQWFNYDRYNIILTTNTKEVKNK